MDRRFMDVDEEESTVSLDDGSTWEFADVGDIALVLVWTPTTSVTIRKCEHDLYEIVI